MTDLVFAPLSQKNPEILLFSQGVIFQHSTLKKAALPNVGEHKPNLIALKDTKTFCYLSKPLVLAP